MEWWAWVLLALGGVYFLWRSSKDKEATAVAGERLNKDTRLYQNIKTGMREFHWREQQKHSGRKKNGELIFESAHMCAYHVDHFAESRVGFYFKDLGEYGLYGCFVGNDDDVYESYYRSDRSFQEEGKLIYRDE
jgi:hypothetical protein